MDKEDLELFERSLRHATETHTGAALDAALAELGWHDALATDLRAAVSLLFELQGTAHASSSGLPWVVAHGLDRELNDAQSVVLPPIGRHEAPGQINGDQLTVNGLASGALDGRASLLVVATANDGHVATILDSSTLEVSPVHGIDPALDLVEITGAIAVPTETGVVDWIAAVRTAQIALGHELVGASRRMLELARVHALDRVQFGRPIGAFQAVRHRLAETLVAIETAAAALDGAWLDPSPHSAAVAKALAGRGARTAARHCQQVLAGIGFTTEHDLHLYVRRVLVLEQLFGGTKPLTKEFGQSVIDSGRLPELLPL